MERRYRLKGSINVYIRHKNWEMALTCDLSCSMVVGAQVAGWSILEMAAVVIFLHAHTRQSLQFTQSGATNKKHPVSRSSAGKCVP